MPSNSKHSRVVQRKIRRPKDALKAFNNTGREGDEICLVCVPKWNKFFYLAMNIPSGVYVLHQRWGANKGHLTPGMRWFWAGWNRVSHIVSRVQASYNAPVKNCPTSDNVMIAVDVSIQFQIEDAPKFVYNLGASRFDELMAAQTDEAIRGLVRGVRAMAVLDLREEFARGMKTGLNTKLSPFGIKVAHVKITHVELPRSLADTLQNTTSFQAKIEQQEKSHQATMRVLYDDAEITLTGIRRANERRVQDLNAKIQRALITREERVLQAEARRDVAIVDANANFSVAKTQANSEKLNAEAEGKRLAVEKVERVRAEAEALKIQVAQELETSKLRGEAIVAEADSKAKAIEIEGNVEEKASTELMEQRKFDVLTRRASAMVKLARKGKMVIGGKTGEQMLQQLSSPTTSLTS